MDWHDVFREQLDDWEDAYCLDCGDELRPDEDDRCAYCVERHQWEEAITPEWEEAIIPEEQTDDEDV